MLEVLRRFSMLLLAVSVLVFSLPTASQASEQPPWNARDPKLFDFTVYGVDNDPDLHGDPADPQLVLFVGGNQFMVMPQLIAAFQHEHPEISRIFYETLPPGILAEQAQHGNIEIGNLVLHVKPDIYEAGKKRMTEEVNAGRMLAPITYARNRLALMVRHGNPKNIRSLRDLGRADVRVAMPNPKTEGVARQIEAAYVEAGGAALDHTVMVTKVQAGTTVLTQIHHRQTPIAIMAGTADVGPVWITEALFQEKIGNPISHVVIPASENETAVYQAAIVRNVPHASAAAAYLRFLQSPAAVAIYAAAGFLPARP